MAFHTVGHCALCQAFVDAHSVLYCRKIDLRTVRRFLSARHTTKVGRMMHRFSKNWKATTKDRRLEERRLVRLGEDLALAGVVTFLIACCAITE